MKRIYLDNAATTPVKKEVFLAMKPYFFQSFGNPSSIHFFGQQAAQAINQARLKIASFLNCLPEEIIFTSGATEANNLAIKGIIEKVNKKPHIIISSIEHHSVLDACKQLEKEEIVEVTYLPVSADGLVDVIQVKKAIKPNTVLVSIMYVNNEIGTIQPIQEIGKVIGKENKRREKFLSRIYFHTDAVQALEYLDCNVKKLNVDLLSLSAHKIGGPKGVGALFCSREVALKSQMIGGGQERKLRAGTENVTGIVGLGKAVDLLSEENVSKKTKKIQNLRDKLINGVLNNIPDVLLNGDRILRSPNNVNFCFKYIEGEGILLNLDLYGIAASSGSACTSGSLEPSHVIIALGRDPQTAQGSIRFTLNSLTNARDIDFVLQILPKIVKKLRKISPFGKKYD